VGEADRRGRGEATVHLDKDLDVGSDRISHGLHQLDRAHPLGTIELPQAGAERVELERPVAALDDPPRGGLEVLRRALDGVPAVRVRLDAIAHTAAEQAVHRLAERLADDVPAGHLQHGDARHDDLAGAPVVELHEALDERFDLERIRARDAVLEDLGEIAEERFGAADHAGLADAGEPVVGRQLDQGEIAPRRADDAGSQAGDLHRVSPPPPWLALEATRDHLVVVQNLSDRFFS
jgi:hypothetical protein